MICCWILGVPFFRRGWQEISTKRTLGMQTSWVTGCSIYWYVDSAKLGFLIFPVPVPERMFIYHSAYIFSLVLATESRKHFIPEGAVRNPSPTNWFAVEITKPFPRRNSLKMRRIFGSYEPRQNQSKRSWLEAESRLPLGCAEPGVPRECDRSIAPWLSSNPFNGIIAVTTLLIFDYVSANTVDLW